MRVDHRAGSRSCLARISTSAHGALSAPGQLAERVGRCQGGDHHGMTSQGRDIHRGVIDNVTAVIDGGMEQAWRSDTP